MDAELAEVWVEQMQYVEEAECTVMHLFSQQPWASSKAFEWIAAEGEMYQLCGYLLLARLFMQGFVPNERDAAEFLDQAATILPHANTKVGRATSKSVIKFMDLGEEQEAAAERMLQTIG